MWNRSFNVPIINMIWKETDKMRQVRQGSIIFYENKESRNDLKFIISLSAEFQWSYTLLFIRR